MTTRVAGQQGESPRYSPRTQRLITRARVSRDVLVGLIGVVFAILGFTVTTPSYALSEPVAVFGIIIAVIFLTAAIVRAPSNEFNRTWSRGFRVGISTAVPTRSSAPLSCIGRTARRQRRTRTIRASAATVSN